MNMPAQIQRQTVKLVEIEPESAVQDPAVVEIDVERCVASVLQRRDLLVGPEVPNLDTAPPAKRSTPIDQLYAALTSAPCAHRNIDHIDHMGSRVLHNDSGVGGSKPGETEQMLSKPLAHQSSSSTDRTKL